VDDGGSISVEVRNGTDVTFGTSPQPVLKAFGREAAVLIARPRHWRRAFL